LPVTVEWGEKRLEELATQVTVGWVGPMTHEYRSEGIPFLRSLNVRPFRIDAEDIRYITPEFHANIRKSRLSPGDVVIVRTGAPGTAAVVPDWLAEANCSDLVIVRPGPDLDARYLTYYLNAAAQHQIAAETVGAVQQHFNIGSAKRLQLWLPPLREQLEIVRVLGALDDKIAANRALNETLEATFQALFRSWCMDFDPVVAKSEGRRPPHLTDDVVALFPDRLEDSSMGPVPAGWKPGTVGDLATNPRRKADPTALAPSTPYMGLEHLPRRSIVLDAWGEASAVTSAKWGFKSGEVLFGKLRPYFHKVGVALCAGICSTDILVVAPKAECDFGLLLGALSTREFVDYADGTAGGTRQPRTSWRDMARYSIAIPPEPIRILVTGVARQAESYFRAHAAQTLTLTALRETLLPPLLSGELRVRQAEPLVEEAI